VLLLGEDGVVGLQVILFQVLLTLVRSDLDVELELSAEYPSKETS
jgi:hypothetical protein